MDSVLHTLKDTFVDLTRQVEVNKSFLADARERARVAKTQLDDAEKLLAKVLATEKEKRAEAENFRQFLAREPNGGTPTMRARLDALAMEVNTLVQQLPSAQQDVREARQSHNSAVASITSAEERSAKTVQEHLYVAERMRELASEH